MDMSDLVTIVSSLGELGGFGVFLWYVYRGLKAEISNLNRTIEAQERTLEAQRETLEAMDMRVRETEKFRDLYRQFLNDLPEDIDKYRSIISRLKDEVIEELEEAIARKDEKLKEFTQAKLAELDAQEKLLEELPKLRDNLVQAHNSLEARLGVLDKFQPWKPLGKMLKDLERAAEQRGYGAGPLLLSGSSENGYLEDQQDKQVDDPAVG
jgi:DNA repair exonuclease SbcCD ATPase subunit